MLTYMHVPKYVTLLIAWLTTTMKNGLLYIYCILHVICRI